ALRLQAESPATLTRDFAAVLRGIVVDAEVRAAWTEAFDLLVRGLSGEIQPPFNPGSPRRKVIVSGTGWSGSGAIYDYLREYTQIRAIRGESTAFEGQGGFRGFLTTSAE